VQKRIIRHETCFEHNQNCHILLHQKRGGEVTSTCQSVFFITRGIIIKSVVSNKSVQREREK